MASRPEKGEARRAAFYIRSGDRGVGRYSREGLSCGFDDDDDVDG